MNTQNAGTDEQTARRQKYRAKKAGVEGSFTGDEWNALKQSFGCVCLRCFAPESEQFLVPDHVVPLGEPGSTNWISNIQPLCRACNSSKRGSVDLRSDFLERSRDVRFLRNASDVPTVRVGQEYIEFEGRAIPLSWALSRTRITVQRSDYSGTARASIPHHWSLYVHVKPLPPEEQ